MTDRRRCTGFKNFFHRVQRSVMLCLYTPRIRLSRLADHSWNRWRLYGPSNPDIAWSLKNVYGVARTVPIVRGNHCILTKSTIIPVFMLVESMSSFFVKRSKCLFNVFFSNDDIKNSHILKVFIALSYIRARLGIGGAVWYKPVPCQDKWL